MEMFSCESASWTGFLGQWGRHVRRWAGAGRLYSARPVITGPSSLAAWRRVCRRCSSHSRGHDQL